jgi:hypothetical protein
VESASIKAIVSAVNRAERDARPAA